MNVYVIFGNQRVGGAIEAIEWDNTGRRLAVTFSKSTDNESNTLNVVAVFVSKVHGNNLIQLLPWCETAHSHHNTIIL